MPEALDVVLAEESKRIEKRGKAGAGDKLTGSEAIALHREQVDNDPSLKRRSREYVHTVLDALEWVCSPPFASQIWPTSYWWMAAQTAVRTAHNYHRK